MYIAEIETRVAGIPCIVAVISHDVDGDKCYSEWEVLDRKGYGAAWLAKKLTSSDAGRIEREIGKYFSDDGY